MTREVIANKKRALDAIAVELSCRASILLRSGCQNHWPLPLLLLRISAHNQRGAAPQVQKETELHPLPPSQ